MKVAICDATKSGTTTWMQRLDGIREKYEIEIDVTCYESAETLLFHMEDAGSVPDLLLLDAHMPAMSGIEAAQKIRDELQLKMEIVFLTADPNHWPEAFDVDALHYLIKEQVPPERLEQVILKAAQRIGERKDRYLSFRCAGNSCTVPIKQIRYFATERRIITVHYGLDDQTFDFYTPIGKLENELSNKGFLRIHKSFIISMRYVKSFSRSGGVVMDDGQTISLGRAFKTSAQETLEEYLRRNKTAAGRL